MDEKDGVKALQTLTSPASVIGDAKDTVDEFLFAVSYKEKDCLVPTYMTIATNKLLHNLAEIKETYFAQLEKERHHLTQNAVSHKVATYDTTEDVAVKLISILNLLLENARETPIDLSPNQPHMTIEEALKTSELEIMQDSFLSDVLKWMKAHPFATAFHIAMVLLMLCPGLAVAPLLEIIGFGAEGIIGGKPKFAMYDEIPRSFFADQITGSVVASYQAIAGPIAARSLFAVLQSTAMGGYGVVKVYKAVRAAIALAIAFEIGRAQVQHGCSEKRSLIPTAYTGSGIGKGRDCASCVIQ